MHITQYKNARDFLKENQAFLEVNEAVNSLMLGLAISQENVEEDETVYISIKENDRHLLCCSKTPGRNLILYADSKDLDSLLALLIEYLSRKDIEIPGVLGSAVLAKNFADQWVSKFSCEYKIAFKQMIYVLNEVKAFPDVSGKMIKAASKDADLITEWFYQFVKEAMREDDKEGAYKIAKSKIDRGEVFLWVDKETVSTVSISRPCNNGITINYVYTPPYLRKKGYATRLTAEVSQLMLDQGYEFCTLFTDLANPTSNRIYQSIGYTAVDEFMQIEFSLSSS